jgi:hypothetical protein
MFSVVHPTTDIPANGSFAPEAAIRKSDGMAMSASHPILLQKSFWGGERKFLEPLMRFARGDVRDHIVSSKSITDLRSRVEKRRSSGEIQRSTFARFLGLFDFRLLQQYPPHSGHAATAAPCSRADNSSHARRPG